MSVVLILVLLNAFFVAAEFALVKVRSSRIDALADEGNRNAKYTQKILNNLDAYLSACQLGITLASLGLGWVGEPAVSSMLEPLFSKLGLSDVLLHTASFLVGFIVITIFHITLGEQFPKTYAIRKAEDVSMLSAGPMVLMYKIMFPFIWMLNGISNWMLRLSGIEPTAEHEQAHTEEEIRILMKESNKSGFIDNNEMKLVNNIFNFAETTAREVMIPRTELVCLYLNNSYEQHRELALEEMHTRYPVCETDKDSIIGFIHIKDLLKYNDIEDIRTIIRPITKVPETMQISELLKLMQKKKTQMTILIDEYGGTSGLVTVEDIIEEIVGEIQDEFDEERPSIEIKTDNTYSIDGLLLIDVVNDHFGFDIDTEDYDTIGGWVYSHVELPPDKGKTVTYNKEYQFTIEETDNLRISRVRLRKLDEKPVLEPSLES
ncbi:hemolysin family protein [Paenibacillus swuensis]|uniref:hemolysin family protein n=1 Tax=Paenibacillus swuensis TaxID=1178515 RepID=UPI001E35EDD9|nr:hemolysin family protein [Paenibacillus swuensis]